MQVAYHHDVLYGRPGQGLQRRMQHAMEQILAMDSWHDFWRLVGLQAPGNHDVTMTHRLRQGWQRSLGKGYHKEVGWNCKIFCISQVQVHILLHWIVQG